MFSLYEGRKGGREATVFLVAGVVRGSAFGGELSADLGRRNSSSCCCKLAAWSLGAPGVISH